MANGRKGQPPQNVSGGAVEAVAPRSSVLRPVLIGWSAVTVGALLVLGAMGVKLGQGVLFYQYSFFAADRAARLAPLLPVAAIVAAAVLWAGRGDGPGRWRRRRRWRARVGHACAAAALLSLGAWTWWAPP